jgi:hypothetical protein
MSKSPTEAELIGLMDNLGLIELFHEFLEFLTMKKIDPPTIYQDCNAELGKEMVDEDRVKVKHICAEEMEADGFSKPYDPAEHKKFAVK